MRSRKLREESLTTETAEKAVLANCCFSNARLYVSSSIGSTSSSTAKAKTYNDAGSKSNVFFPWFGRASASGGVVKWRRNVCRAIYVLIARRYRHDLTSGTANEDEITFFGPFARRRNSPGTRCYPILRGMKFTIERYREKFARVFFFSANREKSVRIDIERCVWAYQFPPHISNSRNNNNGYRITSAILCSIIFSIDSDSSVRSFDSIN